FSKEHSRRRGRGVAPNLSQEPEMGHHRNCLIGRPEILKRLTVPGSRLIRLPQGVALASAPTPPMRKVVQPWALDRGTRLAPSACCLCRFDGEPHFPAKPSGAAALDL